MPCDEGKQSQETVKPAKKKFSLFRPKKPSLTVDKNELKARLTPLQYKVTQEKHTERSVLI